MPRILMLLFLLSCSAVSVASEQPWLIAQFTPQTPIPTPTQAASLKAEVRKEEERYLRQLAKISQLTLERTRKAVPLDSRIADTAIRHIAALEKERGYPLTDEQKKQIGTEVQLHHQNIAAAKEAAKRLFQTD